MKHSRLGRRLAAAILSAAMLAALLPITALAAGDGSQPSPAVVETVPSGAVSEAVQAFLDAVQAIAIPEEIDDETGPALSEQIGAAFDAYEALTDEEAALEDVQAAAALLQQASDALTGGAQTMALLTGEEFSIVVNVGYLDDSGNFVRTGSKTMVSTCRYGCGHSGYNHTMNAAEIVAQSGYTGSSWRVTRYGYWDTPADISTVNYNITGSAPYKADQAIWVIGEKPTIDQGGPSGDGNGSGNGNSNTNETVGSGKNQWTQTLVYHANYPGNNDPTVTVRYNVSSFVNVYTITPKTFAACGFTVPEGYQLKANSWYSASNGGSVLCSMGGSYGLNYNNNNKTIHLYAQYTPTTAPINAISLTYDAQGGKVEGKDTHTITIHTTEKSYSFNSLEPVREGYTFLGWYDGTGANAHQVSWPYTLSLVGAATEITKTVYAKWEQLPDTHADATIIYQNGGGSGGPETETVSGSQNYTIKSPDAVGITAPEGKIFSHWAKGNDMYFPGDMFMPADGSTNTFVAIWKDDDSETGNATYTVQWFDKDGNTIKADETRRGTLNNPVSVTEADKLVPGYTFDGTDSRNVLQAVLENASGTVLKLYFTKNPFNWDDLNVEKTADKTKVKPGDVVTYTVKVENHTGKDLTSVKVEEKLDSNLEFVSFACQYSTDITYIPTTGICSIPSLKKGDTAVLTIKAKVKDGVADNTVIGNTAKVTDATDEDDEKLPDDKTPADSVKVTVDNPPVTYTVTYTDGVEGEEIFPDEVHTGLQDGAETPAFNNGVNPTRDGYIFKGWTPDVAETVTGNVTYIAVWEVEKPDPTETPDPTESPKPTETPKPTESPKPTATPKPTESSKPTETPKPTESPKPSETPAPTATPSATEAPKDDHPEIEQARRDGTWGKDDDNGNGTTGGTAGGASAASGSSTIPQTGDDFSLALWLVLLAAALAALVGLGFLRRRNSRD